MSVVDDRGRVFGRINLIDAAVVLLVAITIPAAYGAYVLFRAPQARLLKVVPESIVQGTTARLLIYGENLRPFMRVSMNDIQARDFLIGSTKGAEANLPDLPPGTYDVVLYDYAQEVSRLSKAVTVTPATPTPTVSLEAAGAFVGLDQAGIDQVKPGLKLTEGDKAEAEVVSVGTPSPAVVRLRVGDAMVTTSIKNSVLLPATLQLRCYTELNADGTLKCTVPGVPQSVVLAPDVYLTFRTPGRWFAFQVHEVHLDRTPPVATAHVQFVLPRDVAARMKVGDVDGTVQGYGLENRPRIMSLGATRAAPVGAAPASVVGESPVFVDATVRVPLQKGAQGWQYRSRPFKAGMSFAFETEAYVVGGTIVDYSVAVGEAGR